MKSSNLSIASDWSSVFELNDEPIRSNTSYAIVPQTLYHN